MLKTIRKRVGKNSQSLKNKKRNLSIQPFDTCLAICFELNRTKDGFNKTKAKKSWQTFSIIKKKWTWNLSLKQWSYNLIEMLRQNLILVKNF